MLEDDDLNTTDRDILQLLEAGRCTPRYLSAELDLQQPYVSQRLRRLVEHDRVDRVDRGLYELASGETIHVSEDLADDLYAAKGRGTTYEELLRELVDASRSDPDPTDTAPESAPESHTIDVESVPDADTSDASPESEHVGVDPTDPPVPVPKINHLYEELPGEGRLLDRRVAATIEMYERLSEKGSAEKGDFLELVDPDELGYASADSVWANMVKGRDTLRSLPGVSTPPTGRTTWRCSSSADE